MDLRLIALAAIASASTFLHAQASADLAASVDKQLPALIETYKKLHRNPELSHHEEKTSAYLAGELRKLGYTVTERVGKYEDGSQAYGIVAVLQNGVGPRLLIRADMDALPVEEKTGLDYASKVRSVNAQGQDVAVMHACGHDIHVTVLLGTARELVARKSQWHGTVMLIGQPSEETIDGARAMLADNLYQRFGRPDLILAEHDSSTYAAGSIAIRGGPQQASSTSIDVIMRGIGSHGSAPQNGKDPVLMAAEFVVLAQSIVARQVDPQQPAVLTVGMIHGGTKRNIIPEEVTMGLTLRAYSDKVRDQIIDAVRRTAEGVAVGYGLPQDRMPVVTVSKTEITPVLFNDPALADRLRAIAIRSIGADHVEEFKSIMGSEDVGLFRMENKIPGVMFYLGAADPQKLAHARETGVPLPGPHSPLFAPVYSPTIRTGVIAMSAMTLDLLK
ncbi:MAG: amidohydrolase [Acidobacteria bacterium]|nr:amidohydrolase [Acidobacteriota bacterium]